MIVLYFCCRSSLLHKMLIQLVTLAAMGKLVVIKMVYVRSYKHDNIVKIKHLLDTTRYLYFILVVWKNMRCDPRYEYPTHKIINFLTQFALQSLDSV